jgi:hypothetical protein
MKICIFYSWQSEYEDDCKRFIGAAIKAAVNELNAEQTDTVPKSVSVPVKKEHSLKTLLVLQITITNNKIQRLCYYQRNSFLP